MDMGRDRRDFPCDHGVTLALLMNKAPSDDEAGWDITLTGQASALASHEDFEMVTDIVMGRCSMCFVCALL